MAAAGAVVAATERNRLGFRLSHVWCSEGLVPGEFGIRGITIGQSPKPRPLPHLLYDFLFLHHSSSPRVFACESFG